MKIIILFFLASSFLLSAQAETPEIRWDLQVTDPEFELVNYRLDKKAHKPYLKKTSWRCQSGETEFKGQIALKKLSCDYSIEKAGTVTTIVSCSPKRPYSEGFLELYDERKDLTFQVMLTCRVTKKGQ